MGYSIVIVTIGVSVEFDPAVYSAPEGDEIVFMVVLRGQSATNVLVDFSTSDQSATGTKYIMHDIVCFIIWCRLFNST